MKKYRTAGITILAALLMGALIGNITLKPLIARIRPCDINTAVTLLIPRPEDYSFPSGHTLSSFTAATVIFLRNKRIGAAAVMLAGIIAFSRLYLYVHYPSDVIAGFLIGVIIGVCMKFAVNKFITKINTGTQKIRKIQKGEKI